MQTKFIAQLDKYKQNQIKQDLKFFLKEELELTDKEMEKELELAMSSRLSDLKESIDINPYIN